MLHEVLLALSGHPSPLFGDGKVTPSDDAEFLLSPSEKTLLKSLGNLSHRHRKLRQQLTTVAANHPSVICRAVAVALQQTHLERFQQRIVDVERKILTRDAALVGAYDIVPLAAVVAEFDDWQRLMVWYGDLADLMMGGGEGRSDSRTKARPSSGAKLIDYLHDEMQTGFPEIESAATELTRVAEMAWLRQLSSWLVYGQLPAFGSEDFFIRAEREEDGVVFSQDKALLPALVTAPTAATIVFIGKSIHQVQSHKKNSLQVSSNQTTQWDEKSIASAHLQRLSSLSLPLAASQFSRTIADIRLSLSQNVLQHLLPTPVTVQLLSCLRQFFLLVRGEFAVALIEEAENRIAARQQSMGRLATNPDPAKALQALKLKDAELHQALQNTFKTLASYSTAGRHASAAEFDEQTIADLDYAQRLLSLGAPRPASSSRPSTADSAVANPPPALSPIAFNDLLFPAPVELTLHVPPPLDLFLAPRDVVTYSHVHAYLLAIRRGHMKLSALWKRPGARRSNQLGRDSSRQSERQKRRQQDRIIAMRKVWATCSAAVFLLSETAAFFEGEVISGSCAHFQRWVEEGVIEEEPKEISKFGELSISSPSVPTKTTSPSHPKENPSSRPLTPKSQRDPETLATGHRSFLGALTYALLLTDAPYTRELRSLLGAVDQLTAFFGRLLDLQARRDALDSASTSEEEDPTLAHLAEEERIAALGLDRARKTVDSGLKAVLARLRAIDQERVGSLRFLDISAAGGGEGVAAFRGGGKYEVWRGGGGVNSLLMKLDFGRTPVGTVAVGSGALLP